MSLVHSTYSEATQNARHPSMQFDMKMAPSSHGPTKRKPSGGSGSMEQEDEVHPSPTKRACTSPSVHQGRHVPSPSDTPESEAALTFVNFLDQKIISKPARTHPRLHIGNIPQAHISSAWSSSSIPGALPDEPTDTQLNVGGRDSDQTQPPPLEKARVAKGKRPDRGRKPKSEAARDAMAQEFLSFLARNVQMTEPNRGASLTASEPEQCARSRFGPAVRYPGAVYASPFERMLLNRTPWAAAAAAAASPGFQAVGCECSICVRELAKGLENAEPSAAATPPLPDSKSCADSEGPPSLETMGAAPPPNSSEPRDEAVRMAPPPSLRHFLPQQVKEEPSAGRSIDVSHSQAEAGPSRPSTRMCQPPQLGQEFISMLFAASMSGLGNTVD